MNAVAMFLQQLHFPEKHVPKEKTPEESQKHALFHSLLSGSLTPDMLNDEQAENNKENTESVLPLLYPAKIMVNKMSGDDELNSDIIQLAEPDEEQDASIKKSTQKDMEDTDSRIANQTLMNIYREVHHVLTQLKTEPANRQKAAPALLQLLQDWVKAAGSHMETRGMGQTLDSMKQGEAKEQMIWKDLLHAYEKRHQLASNQQYSANAHVTTTDIARWLERAMEKIPLQDQLTVQRTDSPVTMPISRMEQVVIQLNQGQHLNAQGKQLIDQLQSMMKSGHFFTFPNKGNQITLSLRPENLGDMMIRFTQVNGEMTVKIMVTTQSAKEMLETNMHQLRNMFSPQQVVVEKQDTFIQQSQETEKNMKDDQQDEKQQEFNDSSEEERGESEDDFDTRLQTLLMDEEV